MRALTKEERWILAEALRTHAEAELRRLTRPGVTVIGRLRHDLKRWSEEATRLAELIDQAARVDIWPDEWRTPRPG